MISSFWEGDSRATQFVKWKSAQLVAGDDGLRRQADVAADFARDERVVAGQYFDGYARFFQRFKGGPGRFFRRIEEGDVAQENEIGFV
jgi:hypothetical protein